MAELYNSNIIELAYTFTNNVQSNNFDFVYGGTISSGIVNHILTLTEEKLNSKTVYYKARKRVYFVAVEILQNITRHQTITGIRDFDILGMFSMKKYHGNIYLTTANLVDNNDVEKLKSQIEYVNSLTQEELSEHYNNVLRTGQISEKGGAGLGLIAIAKKACGPFKFHFHKVNERFSVFYFEVSLLLNRKGNLDNFNAYTDSLKNVLEIHSSLRQNNAVLNYTMSFNHTNFINLFSIVLNQLSGSYYFRKRVINTMIEMIQNVVYYSEDYDEERHQKPGIFILVEQSDAYFLTSGNYLLNEKVETLQNKLSTINALERKYFDGAYRSLLFEHFNSDEEQIKPDLSFLEMRIRSRNKLYYNIIEINDKYSFFVLQNVIRKRF